MAWYWIVLIAIASSSFGAFMREVFFYLSPAKDKRIEDATQGWPDGRTFYHEN